MDLHRKYTAEELERKPYRTLQQLAKAMSLPSNVKKVCLIQLIFAKTNKSAAEVESIVNMVRWERQRITISNSKKKGNKKRVQGSEITSTNNTLSPPIDLTPKHSALPSPDTPLIIKYPRMKQQPSPRKSDRVLRSTIRTYKKPNYSMMNDSILNIIEESETRPRDRQLSVVQPESRYPKIRLTARCLVKKFRPQVSILKKTEERIMPPLSDNTPSSMLVAVREQNKTITIPEKKTQPYIQSIGFRHSDGKISKINAIVQKQTSKTYALECYETPTIYENFETRKSFENFETQKTYENFETQRINENYETQKRNGNFETTNTYENYETEKSYENFVTQKTYENFETPDSNYNNVQVTIQDNITNSDINGQSITNQSMNYVVSENTNYPNMSAVSHCEERIVDESLTNEHEMSSYSMYYHKKIRSEQVRNKTQSRPVPIIPCNVANDQRLPNIHNVFSRFKDFSQPLYVKVSDPSVHTDSYPEGSGGWVLENLYTVRRCMETAPRTNQDNTRSVFCTRTIPTPLVQYSTGTGDHYSNIMNEQTPTYNNYCTSDEVSQICELVNEQDMTLRRYHEAANASNSSLDSVPLGAAVTIPEMVEDALELISQDGDYMERIGMDERMQCILCSWAGPKFLLEKHLREEHSQQIDRHEEGGDWVVTYKLGNLVEQEVWLSNVCERDNTLYILSAKYTDPECFQTSLTTLSSDRETKTGKITLFNKVTGEPFVWEGVIQELPTNMPYDNPLDCMKIDLSKLELLPNSANLKLHNRSLVLNSPSKVVVGQPELNDIHIMIFVKFQDF